MRTKWKKLSLGCLIMTKKNILIFPGDEVGPEITNEAIKVIDYFNESKLTNI